MTDLLPPAATSAAVRAVLWEWDPIGVRAIGTGWPEDEYDDLIDPILQTLRHSPDIDELADKLHAILETDCGLPAPHGCREAAAQLLLLMTGSYGARM